MTENMRWLVAILARENRAGAVAVVEAVAKAGIDDAVN